MPNSFRISRAVFLALLLTVAALPAQAQTVAADTAPAAAQVPPGIHGRLLDDRTGEPVAGARITLIDGGYLRAGRTVTAADGSFHLDVRTNDVFSIRAERSGYRRTESASFTMAPGARLQVEMRVSTDVVVLAPLTVVSAAASLVSDHQLAGFHERRMKQPFGRYMGPEEIERINPFHVTDVLQQFPRVQLDGGLQRRVSLPSSRPSVTGAERCTPNVYLDAALVPVANGDWNLNQMVAGSSVVAVEVYDSPAMAPGEFPAREDPLCGVIVIWTRVGVDRR